MELILSMDSVIKHFHGRQFIPAINGVSLKVIRGINIGIIGETGCGKTTLCKLITLLLNPDEGEIFWKSINMKLQNRSRIHLASFRKSVRLLFQNPNAALHPNMSIRQILNEPLALYSGQSFKSRIKIINDLLEKVHLSSPQFINRYPSSLSGGEKRKISIARCLATNPEIIVADEPVSGLDSLSSSHILNVFGRIYEENGTTFLIATHDQNVVEYLSHVIYVMYGGKIIEKCENNIFFHDLQAKHHPYSKLLLDFRLDKRKTKQIDKKRIANYINHRKTIQRDLTINNNVVGGCIYKRECLLKKRLNNSDICDTIEPTLIETANNHFIACHFLDKYDLLT